jgi:hypothetical protein
MDIVSGPQNRPISAEKFPAEPLDAVAGNGRADLFGNGYTETGVEILTAVENEYEMPTEQALSAITELQEFGAFAQAIPFGIPIPHHCARGRHTVRRSTSCGRLDAS